MNYFTEIALVEKATSDDETPTPGYVYGELIQTINKSPSSRDNILEQLLSRLSKNSAAVKLKTLRVLKHLLMKADLNFKRNLQRKSETFRPLIDYRGAVDPLRGEAPSRLIREEAKEVLNLLFSDENKVESTAIEGTFHSQESSSSSSTTSAFGFMTGGSSSAQSKSSFGSSGLIGGGIHNKTETISPSGLRLEGFGNFEPPTTKEEGLIDKLMSRISNNQQNPTYTSSPASLSNFGGLYTSPTAPNTSSYAKPVESELSKGPEHVPGRPGGSWLQEPEHSTTALHRKINSPSQHKFFNSENETNSDTPAVNHTYTAHDNASHSVSSSTNNKELETRLVEEITLPGGIRAAPTKEQLTQFCTRASSLDLVSISELLCEKLSSQQWQSALKSLYAIESLLSAGHEQYFSDRESTIVELIEHSQNNSIKEKAYGVLQLLRNENQQMKRAAKPHKTVPKQVSYVEADNSLLGLGEDALRFNGSLPSPSPSPSSGNKVTDQRSIDMFARLKISANSSQDDTIDLLGFNGPQPADLPHTSPKLSQSSSQSLVDELLSFSPSPAAAYPITGTPVPSSVNNSNGGSAPPLSIHNSLISSSPKSSSPFLHSPVGYYHQPVIAYGAPAYPVYASTPAPVPASSPAYANPQKMSMYTTSVFSSPEITSQADKKEDVSSLKNTSFTFVRDEMKKSNKV
eukprot:TRINITY_DN4490_c0_g5_i1.p1 TRINITY_DN4490_c0_g5~~TRINITY_DN4490_c0_g5_i1.p1  ORF type:complete len:687 (-),score=192.35 TRINITY_DN4490_c0_g5_i1:80-2140(-)